LLDLLGNHGFIPIVACIAGGKDGAVFNVNADSMAVACAAGYQADQLVFLTDVEGVLDANKQRIPVLTPQSAGELIASGVAQGGMEAKLRAAIAAVGQGIARVRIVAGRRVRATD
jgi:acetylglutamate kinase